jgi:hypothetical protein
VKRPTNLEVITFAMFGGAAVFALGAASFLIVGLTIAAAGDGGEPVSVAITGTTVGAGFVSLVLAFIFACLGMGMPDFRDWAQTVSASAIAEDLKRSSRSILGRPITFGPPRFRHETRTANSRSVLEREIDSSSRIDLAASKNF